LKTLSVTELLAAQGTGPAEAPDGGITIVGHGLTPSLLAQGNITDPVTGFSTTLRFPGAETQPSSALHASGVPIGTPTADSPFAGMGDFVPHLALRNLLTTPQQATVTVEYPQPPASTNTGPAATGNSPPSGSSNAQTTGPQNVTTPPPQPGDPNDHPEWGAGTGATVGTVTLAPVSVAGQSTVDFSFAAVMNQLPLPLPFVSIRIQYSGPAASMVAELASVDQAQDLVIDSKLMNEGWTWSGSGANPWHLDKQTGSILFLTNESGQPARIGLQVTANNIHYYLTNLKLQPHETRAINLGSLRDAQAADYKNNKIPASATDGAVNWVRIDNVPVTGRVVVVQRNGGVASNYDCCTCQCPLSLMGSGAYLNPLTGFMAVGNAADFLFTALFENCNNVQYPYNETIYAAWSSGNTSVMTMDQTYHGEAHGLSSGTAGNQAQVSECGYYYVYLGKCNCSYQNQATGSGQGAVGASVQISSMQASPATINTKSTPTESTITLELYHFGTQYINGASASTEFSTFSGSPSGNNVVYDDNTKPSAGLEAADGYVSVSVTVHDYNVSKNGWVDILGAITGVSGASKISIVPPPNTPKLGVNLVQLATDVK